MNRKYHSFLAVFFAAFCSLISPADSQVTCLVDFGNDSAQTIGRDAYSRLWNNVHQYTTSGIGNLIATDGRKSGIALDMRATKGWINFNQWGVATPATSAPNDLNVTSAARDWLLINHLYEADLIVSNLPPQSQVRLEFFASSPSNQTRITRYEVYGDVSQNVLLQTSGLNLSSIEPTNANQSQSAVIPSIQPASDGTIRISVKRHQGDEAYLGILKLDLLNDINLAPNADQLNVAGSLKVGSVMAGRYIYSDFENDPEDQSNVFWEKTLNTASTSAPSIVPVQSGNTRLLATQDLGYYYRLCVAPRASSGTISGQTRKSAWFGPVRHANTFSSIHIGSSFTQWPNIPRQFQNLQIASGSNAFAQWQVTSGKNSQYHWENGLSGTIGAGSFSRHEIPTGSYDVVVIQPFNDEWQSANLARAIDYCGRFYQLADAAGSQVYLYQGWPWLSQPISTQNNINSAFEQIRSTISLNSSKPALIIPAGQVIRAILEDAQTGVLKDYNTNNSLSRNNFYIDNLHLGNLGAYAVALTHYATIMKKSPVGLPFSGFDANFYNDNVVNFDSAVAARIQQIVWFIVSSYPNALTVNSSQSNPTWGPLTVPPPVVIPPPAPEPDPPFVTESTSASDIPLLHHAFGSGPLGSPPVLSHMPKAVAPVSAGQHTVEYRINPSAEADGVVFTPHWSYDLKNWTATQPTNTVITRTENTVKISWPNTSRWRFLRIHVSQPAQ